MGLGSSIAFVWKMLQSCVKRAVGEGRRTATCAAPACPMDWPYWVHAVVISCGRVSCSPVAVLPLPLAVVSRSFVLHSHPWCDAHAVSTAAGAGHRGVVLYDRRADTL